jgi:hypothetical protein
MWWLYEGVWVSGCAEVGRLPLSIGGGMVFGGLYVWRVLEREMGEQSRGGDV